MAKLQALVCLLFFITEWSSARTLGNSTPTHHHHHHHHHNHHRITFLMRNVLNSTSSSPKPATTKVTNQIPFPKPLGLFPPIGGIPLSQSNPMNTVSQTLDVWNIGLPFPARATLQELEYGSVTEIEEELFSSRNSEFVGRAVGIFVASSEDGTSHMMAMTASFAGYEFKDCLRFFGVYKVDGPESHVAIIGGSGKYRGANGYAVIKTVDEDSKAVRKGKRTERLLLFDAYLS
ncbi:hypothetical protein K2173_009993 [Erythroxylum novogranatense]|uniref:Dirigent protein n=1 Tax=Erythroxylum novogranatense TaxID=1862640 RepID=A0AAV8SZK0_9ROSI|nr:hypothetical protein K2173_009993 [Erythroxylum novogranatense]